MILYTIESFEGVYFHELSPTTLVETTHDVYH
jgi:hypothetical protein